MSAQILVGDALTKLRELPDESVHCVVTSPPYWGLRAYKGEPGMIGLEPTFEEHLENLVAVFREVRRVLRKDGTVWLNYGDAYAAARGGTHMPAESLAGGVGGRTVEGERVNRGRPDSYQPRRDAHRHGFKHKDLMMMPARVAIALQADGWWVRSEIIWHKPNPMPESCTDRPTSSHEKLFLLSKSAKYFYDGDAVRVPHAEPWRGKGERDTQHDDRSENGHHKWENSVRKYNPSGANLRNVWKIATQAYKGAHFATFPEKLIEPCILAGTSERGVCGECGAPWKRQTKTTLVQTKKAAKTFVIDDRDMAADANDAASNRQKDGHKPGWRNDVETTGWAPTCEHKVATVPATVLDPFAGSGTVGLVAQRLGRDAILIELSPEYAEMARKRIEEDMPMFAKVEVT